MYQHFQCVPSLFFVKKRVTPIMQSQLPRKRKYGDIQDHRKNQREPDCYICRDGKYIALHVDWKSYTSERESVKTVPDGCFVRFSTVWIGQLPIVDVYRCGIEDIADPVCVSMEDSGFGIGFNMTIPSLDAFVFKDKIQVWRFFARLLETIENKAEVTIEAALLPQHAPIEVLHITELSIVGDVENLGAQVNMFQNLKSLCVIPAGDSCVDLQAMKLPHLVVLEIEFAHRLAMPTTPLKSLKKVTLYVDSVQTWESCLRAYAMIDASCSWRLYITTEKENLVLLDAVSQWVQAHSLDNTNIFLFFDMCYVDKFAIDVMCSYAKSQHDAARRFMQIRKSICAKHVSLTTCGTTIYNVLEVLLTIRRRPLIMMWLD